MFNSITLEDLQSIVGEMSNEVAHPQLTGEQLQALICAEALHSMARRDLDPEAKDQARFNKELALGLAKAGEAAPARIVDLFKNAMGQLQVANTSSDNTQFIGAQTRLEMLLSFFNQLAGAMARSSFYHYENAVKSEGKALDLVRAGNIGSTGSAQSRMQGVSYYAGPRVAVVLPETVEEAMDSVAKFLTTLYNAGISGASQWFKGNNGSLSFGARRDEAADVWVNFLDYQEAWADIRAYRMEQQARQAQARSSALGSFLSALDGLATAEKHGNISDAAEIVVVTKRARVGTQGRKQKEDYLAAVEAANKQ